MDKLPNEILDCIFTDLNLFQKQECILVCRRWSHIIRSTSLLSTVTINKVTNLVHLFQILDANPSYRYQIQKLVLRNTNHIGFSKKQLLDYFPNLKSIHLKRSTIKFINMGNDNSQPTGFKNWMNQIEVIEQHFSLQFLSSGVFFGLKTLVLTLKFDVNTYTDVIAYAPNITSLTMINARISLANLDLLQTGLKALQSLTLESAYLMADGELNDLTIENTTTALSISVHYANDDVIAIWLQYITKKYVFLQNFRFIFLWTIEHEKTITDNGLIPLLKNLGSRLKHLDISSSFGIYTILRTLDIQNHNIQMLRVSTLFNSRWEPLLSLGELGRYIQELTIVLNTDSWLKTYDLKEISALKKLRVGTMPETFYRETYIRLNDILDACSNSLESLEIYGFNICCSSTDATSYTLKNLAIHGDSITQSVYRFISDFLPGLDSLTIDEHYMNSGGTTTLKDKNFFHLDISMKGYDYIMITTLSDGISYHYSLGDYVKSELDSLESSNTKSQSLIKRATLEETKGSKRIATFTCKSIKTLVVNKKIAF